MSSWPEGTSMTIAEILALGGRPSKMEKNCAQKCRDNSFQCTDICPFKSRSGGFGGFQGDNESFFDSFSELDPSPNLHYDGDVRFHLLHFSPPPAQTCPLQIPQNSSWIQHHGLDRRPAFPCAWVLPHPIGVFHDKHESGIAIRARAYQYIGELVYLEDLGCKYRPFWLWLQLGSGSTAALLHKRRVPRFPS